MSLNGNTLAGVMQRFFSSNLLVRTDFSWAVESFQFYLKRGRDVSILIRRLLKVKNINSLWKHMRKEFIYLLFKLYGVDVKFLFEVINDRCLCW